MEDNRKKKIFLKLNHKSPERFIVKNWLMELQRLLVHTCCGDWQR